MADSNDAFYGLAQHDDELVEVFDQYGRLPEGGINPALDSFCERKHIDIPSLVKLGARINPPDVLVFATPGGIKFRDMTTGKRWNWPGSDFGTLKIVHAGLVQSHVAIVAEGETDAARLGMLYPEADIAVLPAGAHPGRHVHAYAAQLAPYELVLLAHDYGRKGDEGAELLQKHLITKSLRWLAPIEPEDNCGWGDVPIGAGAPSIPDPASLETPIEERLLVSVRDLLTLEPPKIDSYYEQAILPIGSSAIVHGAKKSFKSWITLDWAAALAQSQPWCNFEPIDEPQRVAVMQFEVPYAFFRQRIESLRAAAVEPGLVDENLLIWTPLNRPRFVAGNTAIEDSVLAELERAGVTVLVFDPIRRAVGNAKINDEDGARPVLHFFQRCQDNGITVIATHHDNKQGERSGGGDSTEMTGSGAFGGDADTIVSVALPKGRELRDPERNLHFLLRNAPSPSARSMRITEDSRLEYDSRPIGESEDKDTPPTQGSDEPSI
ncbi:MAG: AAA family ATPase [Solirubrobacteraceae bacterium]